VFPKRLKLQQQQQQQKKNASLIKEIPGGLFSDSICISMPYGADTVQVRVRMANTLAKNTEQ
jgi:hypothetical protein